MLNKSKGNMYSWCDYTWNPIKGKCPHDCIFCYMKIFPQGELRLDEKALKDDLGEGKTIFVGSSTDMFAEEVPSEWIEKVLGHCMGYDSNVYIFQTKNPKRFEEFLRLDHFPSKFMLGATIETDHYPNANISEAPLPIERWKSIMNIKSDFPNTQFFISIEPVVKFVYLPTVVSMMKTINPIFVSIGADSKGHNLPEPSWKEVDELIKELSKFTEVKIKDNLYRLKSSA